MFPEHLLSPPSEELLKVVKKSIKEDDERLAKNLEQFKKWAECEDYLPRNIPDNMLCVFLRGCKHDMEQAKRKLRNIFYVRTKMLSYFPTGDCNDPAIKQAFDLAKIVPLKNLTSEGNRVTFFTMRQGDIKEFSIVHLIKICLMLADIRLQHEYPNAGDCYVFDAKYFQNSHIPLFLDVGALRRILYISQEALPFRIRNILIVNAPNYIHKVVSTVKLMLKDKLKKRIVITNDLTEVIDKKILPKDYGGEDKTLAELRDDWQEWIIQNRDFFKKQDETKLIGKIPKEYENLVNFEDDMNGVQGTFRSLTID